MIVDFIIILVIALFTFIGYKQGLVKVALKILSFFIALAIASMLYKAASNTIITNTNFDEKIEETIITKIGMDNAQEKMKLLPSSFVAASENTVNEIVASITEKGISIIVFIVLFFALKIVLLFVAFLADLITKLPIIKQFDKTGGIIYGFIKGCLIVTCIFAIISLASPIIGDKYIETINKSFIGGKMYNHNVLLNLLG